MASRPSPNSLIHCAVCGEDYSATYKRCPFCGAKNAPSVAPPPARRRAPDPEPDPEYEPEYEPEREYEPEPEPRRAAPADPDDTYVFDGQDLFDGEDEEDEYQPAYPKGGKRLAEKSSPGLFANTEINWPRVITFVCSLIIIVAALVIVFTGIYPKLRGNGGTADAAQSPSPAVTQPAGNPTQPALPSATDPGTVATNPGGTATEPGALVTAPPVEPATQPPLNGPDDGNLTAMSFNNANGMNYADFTLQPNESQTIALNFTPASWAGTVTWVSSNPAYATVDASGKVTNVNTTSSLRSVVITATAGGISLQSQVYCRGVASQPPASETPATNPPAQSDPPASNTQTPPSGGNVTVGRQGTIVGADGGLRVRSGPGTTYGVVATLLNGNTITVVAAANDGWYQISFTGLGGSTETGYIMGEYISTN